MLRQWRLPLVIVAALAPVAPAALAADEPSATESSPAPAIDGGSLSFDEPSVPTATIRPHQNTLAECLALADRNFPNLWAARARLAYTHAQLEEARWTPWFQWSEQ